MWIGGSGNEGPASDWGWALVITLLVCGVVYAGGGVAYSVKAKGMAPGLGALPHREQWIALAGLVRCCSPRSLTVS